MLGGEDTCLYCVIELLVLALWIFIATRVYHRAEELDMNATVWAIVVFLFGIIALIIFMFASWGAANAQKQRGMAGYPVRGGVYGGQPTGQGPMPAARTGPPDPDFRDEWLDELITDGKLSEARKYLREMIDMARSMGDQTGVRNYAQYEPRINKAAMDSTRRKREY